LGREEDARDAEDGAADEDAGDELAPRAAAAAAVVPGARARGEVASAAGEPGTLFVSRDLDFMDGNNSASGRDVTAGA
jgi:hypothetical protein